MSKFHINKHGVPAPCNAKAGNCPLGGDETHFDNMEEAQEHADKENEKNHGILPGVNSEYIPGISKNEVKEIVKGLTSERNSDYRNTLALQKAVISVEIDKDTGEVTLLEIPKYSAYFDKDENFKVVGKSENGNYLAHVKQRSEDVYEAKESQTTKGAMTMKENEMSEDIVSENIISVIESDKHEAIKKKERHDRMLETAKLEQADLKERGITKVSDLVDDFEVDSGLRRTDPSVLKGKLKEEFKYYSDKGLKDHIETMYNPNTGYSLGNFSRASGEIRVTINYYKD